MKIIDNRTTPSFGSLISGDTFMWGDDLCIKIDSETAFNLTECEIIEYMNSSYKVDSVDITISINNHNLS